MSQNTRADSTELEQIGVSAQCMASNRFPAALGHTEFAGILFS